MKNFQLFVLVILVIIVLFLLFKQYSQKDNAQLATTENSLLVLWTTENIDTIENMVFMYTLNAKKQNWFEDVVLLVWGDSQQLLVGNPELQEHVLTLQNAGIRIIACKACADNLNVNEQLNELGVKVYYTGQFLTDWLKSGKKVLTF